MSGIKPLAGVLPVFQLPYHEDESIDFDILAQEIDWLYSRGADGVTMGMVSEVLRLSCEERRLVADRVCRHSQARHPAGHTIISVGAESTHLACAYARHAEAAGASALMAIPPVSVGLDEDQTRRYYEQIVRAVAIPVIVQDASGYVGRPMSISLQVQLLADFGERVLFKPEATPIGPRLSALRDASAGRAGIFEGTGGIALVDSHRRGVIGTMPGADLIDGIVALWRALASEDHRRVYELSLPISALVALQNGLDGFLAVEKYLLVKQRVFQNTIVRGPVSYLLDPETRQEVDRLFQLVVQAVEKKA